MIRLVPRPALVVGAVLAGATLLGLVVSLAGAGGTTLAAVLVILLGFLKAGLVLHRFMELDTAPAALRRGVDALLVVLALGLVAVLLLAP